jgi:hypothetical protein
MICYKGRSFCRSSVTCGNQNCDLLISPKQLTEAREIELDISYVDAKDSDQCVGFVPVVPDIDADYQD